MEITIGYEGDVAHVALDGSLNTNTASELENALAPVLGKAAGIVFDFDRLEYVSSAGLRVLMIAYKKIGPAGEFAIEGASDEVREVFEITGFSDIFELR